MTAGNKRKSSVPVFLAPPRYLAALPAVRSNSVSLLPQPIRKFWTVIPSGATF